MLALFALALAPTPLGPLIPPATRREFQVHALAVEDALEKGDFAAARAAANHLPAPNLRIEYDDRGVPGGYKDSFVAERDRALDDWSKNSLGLSYSFVKSGGEVRIRFVPTLPVDAQTGLPATEDLRFSDQPNQPQLEVLLALNRGEPSQSTRPLQVRNDVARAIGAYYGLIDSPYIGSYMSHSDDPALLALRLDFREANLISAHIRVIKALLNAVAKQARLIATRPKADVDPPSIDAGKPVQGEGYDFSITITNSGNSPLAFHIIPDCTCFIVEPSATIAAGQRRVIRARMDTSHWAGETKHRIAVYTNDIDKPLTMVPFVADVSPRYRLVFDAPQPLLISGPQTQIDAYLYFPNGKPMNIVSAETQGQGATVRYRAWQGFLADPQMHQGALMRNGYKFTLDVPTGAVYGRVPVTLAVGFDDPAFGKVQVTQILQKGIVADPDPYFGEVAGPATTTFLLTQPGRPFKILSTDIDTPFFSVKSISPRGGDGYKIEIAYAGDGPRGSLTSILKVKTDDPMQPVVRVEISAEVQ